MIVTSDITGIVVFEVRCANGETYLFETRDEADAFFNVHLVDDAW